MVLSEITFDQRDEFKRKSIAEKVISLLQSEIDISPMVIDGGWGTGKTEFCHKLINMMKQDESHHLIYVDAFQADHSDEPLLTILAEVLKILPEGEERNGFIQKALPTLRYGAKALFKAGVGHILRQDATDVADDFDKEIQKAADKAIDSSVELMLKDHVKATESLKSLQTALKDIAAKKPIILFIDELDRCRPNFAVNILEIIKHTFTVEGVDFVLITNTQQLKASVNHCYGHAVDAQRYLDKFVKFRFELSNFSDRNIHSPVLASRKHFFTLVQKNKCLPNDCLKNPGFGRAIEHLVRHHNLSLREIEALVLHIQIVQNLSNSKVFSERNYLGYTLLRLIGVMLVCYRPTLLYELKNGNVDASMLAEFLGVINIPTLKEDANRPDIFELIMVVLAKDCNKNADSYTPSKDQADEWNSYINRGIMGDLPDENEAINEIIETANILAFEK
jgi:hypothetical protein